MGRINSWFDLDNFLVEWKKGKEYCQDLEDTGNIL